MSRRRRKRPAAPGIVAAAVLAVALWILLANVVFVVREVRVAGAGEVPEADVRRLSGIRLGTRIGSVDEERVRLDVESDGRVAFVKLEKRLPSRLVLTVRPRTMDAVILQAGKILVLDSDAYVVQVGNRLPDAAIPYVTGIRASYYQLGRQLDTADGHCLAMKAVIEALKANGATAYASELDVTNTGDMRILTRTGMTVLLGDAENMHNKIAWMAGALADLEARGQTEGQLDVSSGTKADYRPPQAGEDRQEEPAGAETAVESGTSPAIPES